MMNVALAHKRAGIGYVLGIGIGRYVYHVIVLQL